MAGVVMMRIVFFVPIHTQKEKKKKRNYRHLRIANKAHTHMHLQAKSLAHVLGRMLYSSVHKGVPTVFPYADHDSNVDLTQKTASQHNI